MWLLGMGVRGFGWVISQFGSYLSEDCYWMGFVLNVGRLFQRAVFLFGSVWLFIE